MVIFQPQVSYLHWKKQICHICSSVKPKFIALAAADKEVEWFGKMFEIDLWTKPRPPIPLHCNSEATMFSAFNNVYNGKSKNISMRYSYIRELISNGTITTIYVKCTKKLSDALIKALPIDRLWRIASRTKHIHNNYDNPTLHYKNCNW